MRASQLLTIQALAPYIIFDMVRGVSEVYVIGVVMFNCPKWGISVDTIEVKGEVQWLPSPTQPTYFLTNKTINITSCDTLVRVCIPVNTEIPTLFLTFYHHGDSRWVR